MGAFEGEEVAMIATVKRIDGPTVTIETPEGQTLKVPYLVTAAPLVGMPAVYDPALQIVIGRVFPS